MGEASGDEIMDMGWLYIIRRNMFGLQYLRKRYFVLDDHCLMCFKSLPTSDTQEAVRSLIIDSCTHITNDGKEVHHSKAVFVFTIYNTSDHIDQLKLGATSPEEAARWTCSLQNAALNQGETSQVSSNRRCQPFRLSVSKRNFTDWDSASSMHADVITTDVISPSPSPSPWKIFGYQNGLRLFNEEKDRYSNAKHQDNHSAMMSVGVVKGTSEAIFRTLMSLGPSRSEWDFCFCRGNVVEHLDDHTDIIHVQLYKHWLPWGMKRRDLVLRRYWRRDNDGHYVILYHSVIHRKCPPKDGYIRACLKVGGYVVIPINQGKESVVKNMLAIDWKSYLRSASERSITIRALGRIAALANLYKEKSGNCYSCDISPTDLARNVRFPQCDKEHIKIEVVCKMAGGSGTAEEGTGDKPLSLSSRTDATDEFYDVPEPSDDDQSNQEWFYDGNPEMSYLDTKQQRPTSAANFVKKLHHLPDMAWVDRECCYYGASLPFDSTQFLPCSCSIADPTLFMIRGEKYLEDSQKVKANGTLAHLVGADFLRSHKREDDLGSRPGGIVQMHALKGGDEFFFIINMQIPCSSQYTLAVYYMLKTPLKELPLLDRFVNGDDTFRNSKFKLIPHVSKGPWMVKKSVGNRGCLLGQNLKTHYIRGKNYLEVDVDVGSSMLARNIASLVFGYVNNVATEMAFLIQADNEEELPEVLLGTWSLNGLDLSKAVSVDSISSSS